MSAVAYPSEALVNDASLSATTHGLPTPDISWIRGWNFTTDLYRILEHIVYNSQRTDCTFSSLFPTVFVPDNVLSQVQSMYGSLPPVFKESHPMTGDPEQDRYTFQAANIIVTMQVRVDSLSVVPSELMHDSQC